MREQARRLLWGGSALGAAATLVALQRARVQERTRREADLSDVLEANERYYSGLNLTFEGDMSLIEEAWSHADDVTILDVFGGRHEGWAAVQAELVRIGRATTGGEVHAEDVRARTAGDFAYLVCREHGFLLQPTGTRVEVDHRATNVFRREDGMWRMVHHHADLVPRLQQAFGGAEE